MATPHVAGAVLQMLQRHPRMKAEDVKRGLLCMATTNAVLGLDAHTPNRLLHTGEALDDAANHQLLVNQVRTNATELPMGRATSAHVSTSRQIASGRVTPDATTCLHGDAASTPWHGYSVGSVPSATVRVESADVLFDAPLPAAAPATSTLPARTAPRVLEPTQEPA